MNYNKKIVIINNEKVFENEKKFYCDNIDMKSIPEGLGDKLDVLFIARKSNVKKTHRIGLEKIKIASNIFTFLLNIFKTFRYKNTNYFIVSITPYTFFTYIFLFIFRKNTFIYLRSNGYEEYRAILGFFGPFIYNIMYIVVTFKSKIITCQKRLVKKKESYLVFPSELNINWLKNTSKPKLDKPKLLYVGRIKVEKGIFSLLKIFDDVIDDIQLSIVGNMENLKLSNKKIICLGYGYKAPELIKIYDNNNISILPSFTEAHPKVIDESLARMRPVIIFEDISHIIQERSGVFVSKRNSQSLLKTIKFVMSDYSNIQNNMIKNKLPTKQEFISKIIDILDQN